MADRFDFFKSKKEKEGKKQRVINTLKLRVRIKIFSRHTVQLSTHKVIFSLVT